MVVDKPRPLRPSRTDERSEESNDELSPRTDSSAPLVAKLVDKAYDGTDADAAAVRLLLDKLFLTFVMRH